MSTAQPIVIVADEGLAEAIQDILKDEGYAAHAFPDGELALRHLRTGPAPRLVLVDRWARGLTSAALSQAMADDERLREVPVLLFEADPKGGLRFMPGRAPPRDAKPGGLDEALDVLHRVCAR